MSEASKSYPAIALVLSSTLFVLPDPPLPPAGSDCLLLWRFDPFYLKCLSGSTFPKFFLDVNPSTSCNESPTSFRSSSLCIAMCLNSAAVESYCEQSSLFPNKQYTWSLYTGKSYAISTAVLLMQPALCVLSYSDEV